MGPEMARVLVVCASKEGHTEHIAHHVARKLEDARHVTRMINLSSHDGEAGADDYDASILAGSVHRGGFAPELTSFLMRHAPAIRGRPSAFLTVSLSAASHDAHELAGLGEIADRFLFEAGWQPNFVEHVAGAVHDRQLNLIEKVVLHSVVRQQGEDLDASGNTDFTDWKRLDRFVKEFSRKLD
jgi:menaquinone-dependent protoporphyrinogen oxidase